MFRTRLLSGILLVALALLFIIRGGYLLLIVSLLLALIGLMELYRVLGINKSRLGGIGYVATVAYYLLLDFFSTSPYGGMFETALALLFLIAVLFCFVLTYPKYRVEQILGAFFGVFYVSVMLSYIYLTREMIPGGQYIVWLIFLCSWGCDTCAYCVGVLFGKHKMAPVLSPKKSVEGAIGGVIGAALLTVIYTLIFRHAMGLAPEQIAVLAVIAAAGAVISMVGDLSASAIKRSYGIKDYGKLIPGHGGVLDRFDSVIFTAPVIYYLAMLFI